MLEIETRDGLAVVTMNRPKKLNAMARAFWAELPEAAAGLAADEEVRAIVIHGAGRCFSVGGDIDDFAAIGGVEDRRAYMREALGAFRALDELPKPVVAAVHGNAFGGGFELTLVCDIVVADETARFAAPESGIGLIPGPGIVRGRAHLNLHWMKYVVMTGLPLDAEQARLAGIVNFVVPAGEHLAKAEEIAAVAAARSPISHEVGKALLGRGAWDEAGYAAEAIALLQGAPDFTAGIDAFLARRKGD
ncbi:MAG TPA: enoyl-CoA hydratase/isomerase family protein [Solirubrobacterales bacterium]|nr:enoyl-CoA hydratase/isomerase family protein [Solirubrobacterales bacterium]